MTNNIKKSHIVAIVTLFMLAVIPAVAAWSQLPTKSSFNFTPDTHVVNVAPMTVTDTDVVSMPEVKISAKPSYRATAHKVSMPAQCQMQELEQQGAPTARYVRVCG
jgi:hypothetical protein